MDSAQYLTGDRQQVCREQGRYVQSSVHPRCRQCRHASRCSLNDTATHIVSDCWKLQSCATHEEAAPAATRPPRWGTKVGWALVVLLALLLGISVGFNIYSMVVRSHLEAVRLRLVQNAQSQYSSSFAQSSALSTNLLHGQLQDLQGRALSEDPRRVSSSGSNNGDHSGPHKHDALLFLFNALVVGTAVLHITSLPAFHGVQQTVVIFILGLVYSLVQEGLKVKDDIGVFGQSYDMWMDIDPHLLLFTLLPPLLAGDAMAIDISVAKRVANQCLYLASVGVLINGLLTALFLMAYLGWSFLLSLATGAILCATDPVAVVALLKELGASPTLTVQIQGESLLNDGTAIVLFTVAYNMIQGKEYDTSDIIMFLVKTALMAWGLGLFIGYLFFIWIKSAGSRLNHSSTIIQISLTICCAYWSFVMAEGVLHISGVLSTVAASLTLASKMWPHIVCEHAMHDVWHTFESLGNVVIFFLAGALTGNTMVHIDAIDYLHLLVIYVVLMIIRGGLIFGSRPLLRILGKDKRPVSLGEAAVMSWGGLRGAVGLALAVQVRIQRAEDNGVYKISKEDADRILFFVAGVAFLTLIINATTCPALVKKLGISAPASAKKDLQRMLYQQIVALSKSKSHRAEVVESIASMLDGLNDCIENTKAIRKGSSFGEAVHKTLEATAHSTGLVEELHEYRNKFRHVNHKELEGLGMMPSATPVKQEEQFERLVSNSPIDWGRADAVIAAFLALVKSAYWHFLETRDVIPGSSAAEILLTSVAFARSQHGGELVDFDFIFPHAQGGPDDFSCLLSDAPQLRESHNSRNKRVGAGSAQYRFGVKLQFRFFWVVESAEFNVFFAVAVVLNGIFLGIEELYRDSNNDEDFVWFAMEVGFVVAFTLEFFLKLFAYGRVYFFDGWNNFDLLLVISGIVGLIVSRLASQEIQDNSDVSNEARIIRLSKMLKVLRLMRLFRLVRFWRSIEAKLSKKEMSFEVADHMKKMTILQCFVKAHVRAQEKFFRYFCGEPKEEEQFSSVEVARCMLQSQVFVYRAASLADYQLQELADKTGLIHEVNCIRESKVVTEELENFVISAFHKGVLNSREAEAIITPLHKHIKDCMKLIQQSASGVTPEKTSQFSRVTPEKHQSVFTCVSKSFVDSSASDTEVLEKELTKLEACEVFTSEEHRLTKLETCEVFTSEEQVVEGAPASSTDPFQPIVVRKGLESIQAG